MADYVLEYRNTRLATVEVKAWDEALTEGVGQAKDDASKPATDAGQPSCRLWGLKSTRIARLENKQTREKPMILRGSEILFAVKVTP